MSEQEHSMRGGANAFEQLWYTCCLVGGRKVYLYADLAPCHAGDLADA